MVHPLCHWDKMDFKTLQNWLSGLTRYRLKIARHQRILHGRDFVVFAVSYRRIFQSIFFFLNCLISNVLKNVNNVCFNSRKVTFSTAEITLILSFIKKALWNNARAGQDYPHAANNWKFHLWRWEENMYTIFCSDTAFDLVMPTSRRNENLQRGDQLNSSFSKILYHTHVLCLLFACF